MLDLQAVLWPALQSAIKKVLICVTSGNYERRFTLVSDVDEEPHIMEEGDVVEGDEAEPEDVEFMEAEPVEKVNCCKALIVAQVLNPWIFPYSPAQLSLQ